MEVVNMPGGDGTGPQGLGPGTGWGLGPCGAGMRRGLGRGFRGGGFGFRRMAVAPAAPVYREPVELSKEEKIKILEADRADIEAEREAVKKEMEELKKQK